MRSGPKFSIFIFAVLHWLSQPTLAQDVICYGSGWEKQDSVGACEGSYCQGLNQLWGLPAPTCYGDFFSDCEILCDSVMGVGLQTECQCVWSTGALVGVAVALLLLIGGCCYFCCCRKRTPTTTTHVYHQLLPDGQAQRAAPIAMPSVRSTTVHVQQPIQPYKPVAVPVHSAAPALVMTKEEEENLVASYGGVTEVASYGGATRVASDAIPAPAVSTTAVTEASPDPTPAVSATAVSEASPDPAPAASSTATATGTNGGD